MSNGHRWSKFFWADWESDDKLRLCSFAAQGVWMRALCLMHKSNGFLIVSGSAPNWRDLARIMGGKADQIERYFGELLRAGVASRDETGVIFCRRMVNDIKASEAGREYIAKRWANRSPNSPPIRSPNSGPNRKPISPDTEAESRSRASAPYPTPGGVGNQRERFGSHNSGGKKGIRAKGTNPRAEGTNPRATGTNPRANGTNPRSPFVNAQGNVAWGTLATEMRRRAAAQAAGETLDDGEEFNAFMARLR